MYIPDKDEWDELNDNIEDLSEKLDTLLEHFNLKKEEDQDEDEGSEEKSSSETFIEE